jgi:hypothetical protein
MIDITDTRKFIAPSLLDLSSYTGKFFTCATAYYTPFQLCSISSKVTRKAVTYHQVFSALARENLMSEMKKVSKAKDRAAGEFPYFGPTGTRELACTLVQMIENEKPTTWDRFDRNNEPWFETPG